LLDPTNTHWDCRCFAYDFEREEMLWQEFNAGDMVPSVSLSGSNDPAGGTTAGDGGATGDGQTHITVAEVMDVNSTFNFRPLPEGVFGSDGMTSRFVLQKRADSVFDRAYEDPEGRPGCVECAN
jgi:hypothetical protein